MIGSSKASAIILLLHQNTHLFVDSGHAHSSFNERRGSNPSISASFFLYSETSDLFRSRSAVSAMSFFLSLNELSATRSLVSAPAMRQSSWNLHPSASSTHLSQCQKLFLDMEHLLNLVDSANLKLKSLKRVRFVLHVNLWNGDVHDLFAFELSDSVFRDLWYKHLQILLVDPLHACLWDPPRHLGVLLEKTGELVPPQAARRSRVSSRRTNSTARTGRAFFRRVNHRLPRVHRGCHTIANQ